jgi:hypothetical protein
MTNAQRVQSILTELHLGLTPAPDVPDADWLDWLDSFVMPRFCRKCGEVMRLRDGRRGRFYGCSKWPKCDYTEDV